ncbi:hypothetical protein SB780_39035, partial [Burkholderia sp. SIMBA_057]
ILSGDITISTEQGDTTYHPGETFHLQPNELHREAFGSQGVRYLAGRKYECLAISMKVSDDLFTRLSRSPFRQRFRLGRAEYDYA